VPQSSPIAKSLPLIVSDQPVHQRPSRLQLHVGIKRGAHRHAAPIKRIAAIKRGKLAAHILGEILSRIDLRTCRARNDVEVLGLGLRSFLRGQIAILGHTVEHPVPPLDGRLRASERVVIGRPLGQGRQIRCLRITQLVQRLVEVIECRRRHPIGIEPEKDLVKIELKDMVLGEGLLHLERQQRFLDLAVPGLRRGQKEILGHLLGDRRGTDQIARPPLHRLYDVVARRPENGRHVDPHMGVEILVLCRKECMQNERWHGFDRLEQPALACELGHQRAVRSVDPGGHRRLVVVENGVVRQFLVEHPDEIAHARKPGQAGKNTEAEHPAQQAYHDKPLTIRIPDARRTLPVTARSQG
jgi:hypothetical protein